ncbi:MAG: hypothetical protein KJS95_00170 [Gammaproteobacteria bacterium]|nr:hypothetical protein [Gammaproteobacteria bacterium]
MPPEGPIEPTAEDRTTPLGERARTGLTVMWCSFLAASVATMVFFAFVDPSPIFAVLASTGAIPERTALYSIGFFFFWSVCALASLLTASLLAPAARRP